MFSSYSLNLSSLFCGIFTFFKFHCQLLSSFKYALVRDLIAFHLFLSLMMCRGKNSIIINKKSFTTINLRTNVWQYYVPFVFPAHGHVDPDETNICTLELSFIRLRAATGEADLDKLVRQFIYREGLNFALFNYINEVNDDIELLQEEIKNTENIMKNFKSQGITLAGERLNIVKRLEVRWICLAVGSYCVREKTLN